MKKKTQKCVFHGWLDPKRDIGNGVLYWRKRTWPIGWWPSCVRAKITVEWKEK